MTIEEFKSKFREIKNRRFIPSLRKGPTGVGYTLETNLGIKENNISEPDIENIELKAHRAKGNNLITLFTFNRKVWKMPPLEAVKKDEEISVRHISGEIIAVWKLEELAKRFMKKMPALLLVSAHTEERDGKEYFHYFRARLMKNTTSGLLANQFRLENILVDLRLHDKGTSAR
ncbi:MAG TPA: hypothetical protein ENJ45_02235, partial [Phaeodactylibacter sp.]|nr:hypothetical protein [Phaeodactylibacter sp.]